MVNSRMISSLRMIGCLRMISHLWMIGRLQRGEISALSNSDPLSN
jgi:hypothetical protein